RSAKAASRRSRAPPAGTRAPRGRAAWGPGRAQLSFLLLLPPSLPAFDRLAADRVHLSLRRPQTLRSLAHTAACGSRFLRANMSTIGVRQFRIILGPPYCG